MDFHILLDIFVNYSNLIVSTQQFTKLIYILRIKRILISQIYLSYIKQRTRRRKKKFNLIKEEYLINIILFIFLLKILLLTFLKRIKKK